MTWSGCLIRKIGNHLAQKIRGLRTMTVEQMNTDNLQT